MSNIKHKDNKYVHKLQIDKEYNAVLWFFNSIKYFVGPFVNQMNAFC